MRSAEDDRPAGTILILATLDTKQDEALFLKERICQQGHKALVVDAGVFDPSHCQADVPREEVALAGGRSVDEMLRSGDKGECIQNMIRGAAKTVRGLCDQGRFDGILSIGGAQGAAIGTAAMRVLPFGLPKLMVTTIASGQACFGDLVGTSDLTVMHCVVDMFGINRLTAEILTNAAGAIVGMVEARGRAEYPVDRPRIAMTVLGNTTPAGVEIKRLLAEKGYETVGFHANGTGGVAAEALIAGGYFDAMLDLTTHEIMDREYGGKHAAISSNRLEEAAKAGIPQLVVPGCVDYLVLGDLESVPARFAGRPRVVHNPQITLVRATAEEMSHVADIIVSRLNKARGPAAVAVPLQGLSMHNVEGQVFFDQEADRACGDVFRRKLRSDITLHEMDVHINDPAFARACVDVLLDMKGSGS